MSNKADAQAIINAIADGEPNTALEARNAYNALLNELYPPIYRTSYFTPVKTEALTAGFNYSFNFSKSGNRVTMSGIITSIAGKPANTNLFAFTDEDFFGKNDGVTIVNQTFNIDGADFMLTDGVFKCVDALVSTKTEGYRFNITYFTND